MPMTPDNQRLAAANWVEQARRWLDEVSAPGWPGDDDDGHSYARAVGRAEAIIEGLLAGIDQHRENER